MLLTQEDIQELVCQIREMLDEQRARPIELSDKLLSGSAIVSQTSCWVYAIIVVASNAAYSEFAFRDGQTAADTSRLNVTGPSYVTVPIIFRKPMRFDKGLYVQFVTAGSYCFVQYKADER